MAIAKTLTYWYSVNKRDLPWRLSKKPYFIWLSEIILQQTQVNQGLPYYESFVTKYPTVFELAKASESEVLKLWQGLGYYSRARNLHSTAKHIVNEFQGEFPNNYRELLQLKGIGDYTASAMASICFNEVCAVVDGNVYRFLSRYYGIKTPINSGQGQKEFKGLAQQLISKKDPAEFNQAIMEFGAIQCKPKNPDCTVCPFQNECIAFQENIISELPVKLKASKILKRYFNFLVFISDDRKTIIEKRIGSGIWENLYQFPLIESQSILNYEQIMMRIKTLPSINEFPYTVSLYNENDIIHKLSHQHLFTKFWIVEMESLPKESIKIDDIRDYPVPRLISNFIETFNF
jgi:A/G-specific adenine glycosylase